MPSKVVVTGAFSYTGSYIGRAFLDQGWEVLTLTRRPERPHPLQGQVAAYPLDFSDLAALAGRLEGAQVLVNTYWVRYDYPGSSFAQAVDNSGVLFEAARQAGVRRLVHLSVSRPDPETELPYFRGKYQVEQLVKACGIPYAILRPTIIFGDEEVLINNITWLLRHLPLFAVPGDGEYRLQPISVEDLAAIVFQQSQGDDNVVLDTAGPEVFTFNQLLGLLKQATGSKSWLLHVPPGLALALARVVSTLLGDMMLTEDEMKALMQERLVVEGTPLGSTRFSEWANQHAATLGRHYVNELRRHHGKGGRG